MIIFDNVTKMVGSGSGKRAVLSATQATLRSDRRIAVLGSSTDKKFFIDMLAGLLLPTTGRIIRKARVGFPPGHLGGFSQSLSVKLNVAHVARIYGADVDEVVSFVSKMSGLAGMLNTSYGGIANTTRRNLSEILAFCIPFDVYLLHDEVVAEKGKRYNQDARALFEARAKTAGMIIAVQDYDFARTFCDMGIVLKGGQMRLFDDVEAAIAFLEAMEAADQETGRAERRQNRARRGEVVPHREAAARRPPEGNAKRSKEERAARRQRRLTRKNRKR